MDGAGNPLDLPQGGMQNGITPITQPTSGGRGRKSRRRKGRGSGRGGYLMDVAVATGLLGATQLSKGRVGYGFRGRNGYYRSTKRRSSRKSRKSRRSGSRR